MQSNINMLIKEKPQSIILGKNVGSSILLPWMDQIVKWLDSSVYQQRINNSVHLDEKVLVFNAGCLLFSISYITEMHILHFVLFAA